MGARALTLSMAQELRPHGVHVALLVAEGYVETDRSAGRDPASLIPPAEVARAVAYLAGQPARALTHELVITPAAASWIPTG
jgi:NAD(P)-dependent dehydrogenase (short-subunit alcohol dehydrogenase family)